MKISRREAFTGLLATGGAAGLAACAGPSEPELPTSSDMPLPRLPDTLLLNKSRAAALMEAQKVDLLICASPVNIYYLTNQRPVTHALGMNGAAYALLQGSMTKKPTYITGKFDFWIAGTADMAVSDQLDVRLYTTPAEPDTFSETGNLTDYVNAPASAGYVPRQHANHAQADFENVRRRKDEATSRELYATAETALLRAIQDADLPNKTVAIDDPNLRRILARSELDLRIVDGDRLMRNIRLQRSAAELEMIRFAVEANAVSARQAVQAVRNGATFQDIRREFARACGGNLANAKFMVLDSIIPELIPGEIKEGRTFLLDCVSEFEGYHGDFGRTICVGDPTREMKANVDALSHVWDRILPELRPGLKYSDIVTLATQLFSETNIDAGFSVNPHSVGLYHHDEPSQGEFGPWAKDMEIELVENMVLSVDLPLLDTGLGGTAHLEDLVLIGANGPELLHSSDDRFIVV